MVTTRLNCNLFRASTAYMYKPFLSHFRGRKTSFAHVTRAAVIYSLHKYVRPSDEFTTRITRNTSVQCLFLPDRYRWLVGRFELHTVRRSVSVSRDLWGRLGGRPTGGDCGVRAELFARHEWRQ